MLPVIAVTQGDPSGIGPEIIAKAFAGHDLSKLGNILVIGDYAVIMDALSFCGIKLNVNIVRNISEARFEPGMMDLLDLALLNPGDWPCGEVSEKSGEASYKYIEKSVRLALNGEIQAVVTAPICKEAVNKAGYHFAGHTEIFTQLTDSENTSMLLTNGSLRVIHVNTHVSMREACDRITCERVYHTIKRADEAGRLLGIEKPRIGVAGFNPHCSENGLFGTEEEKEIIPAIHKAGAQGINAIGPIPPDTVFVKALAGMYDIVVAMYHDQGHIPLKLCGFHMDKAGREFTRVSGVNSTIGLPIIRTSVDHGTAFDRAGKGTANEWSLVEAIEMAAVMINHRI